MNRKEEEDEDEDEGEGKVVARTMEMFCRNRSEMNMKGTGGRDDG